MKEHLQFAGEWETHITVALDAPAAWTRFKRWCDERELKSVFIALERGQTPAQPMMTRQSRGILATQIEAANALARDCQNAGFAVARVKLEVAPWNEDVPQRDDQADARRYFEHHVKLLLPADADLGALQNAVAPMGAHLSRNARRARDDGQNERFVTARGYNVGRETAEQQFEQLMQTLRALPHPILETEREYVVYDSNLALDQGWLPPCSRAFSASSAS